jgi:hypothetical protein
LFGEVGQSQVRSPEGGGFEVFCVGCRFISTYDSWRAVLIPMDLDGCREPFVTQHNSKAAFDGNLPHLGAVKAGNQLQIQVLALL